MENNGVVLVMLTGDVRRLLSRRLSDNIINSLSEYGYFFIGICFNALSITVFLADSILSLVLTWDFN